MFNRFLRWMFIVKNENEIQFIFCFSFSWRNWRKNDLKKSTLTLWLFSHIYGYFKYDLHAIQEQVRVKFT